MRKEIEINGCIEIPSEMTIDAFADAFIEWFGSKGWYFGGGLQELVNGYSVNSGGTLGRSVLEDLT